MKRILSLALFGAVAAVLGGCPIYSDNNGGPYSEPYPSGCDTNRDCPTGYVCGYDSYGDQTCIPGPTADAGSYDASTSSCETTGCPAGEVCELLNTTYTCVSTQPTPDAGPPDTSTPDAGSVACQTNADCASTPGALCLDGVCVAPPNQCFDGTQCPAGDKCVAGACTPSCNPAVDAGAGSCPTGYACTSVGDGGSDSVCTGNPTPCEGNPSGCVNGTVCSQNHCVAPCGPGNSCPAGEVCVQGGCVENQIPTFTCDKDGVQDACASGSICLHHSCYIACDPDAGAGACKSADQFNECKAVTTSNGTWNVCGSSTNLGSDCSPTQACTSSAAVCIDGYCH
ncbi:MAG TPA: hypothetical protein VGI39_10285 [Polyangiaceae bacterium]|jgi:hypothetical protein